MNVAIVGLVLGALSLIGALRARDLKLILICGATAAVCLIIVVSLATHSECDGPIGVTRTAADGVQIQFGCPK